MWAWHRIWNKDKGSPVWNNRLHKTCEMLINGQDTITDIGHACGLGNSSYFGKIFRKYQNCTPIEYRKNGRIVISYVRNKIAMRKLGKMFLLMFRFIAIMEKHFSWRWYHCKYELYLCGQCADTDWQPEFDRAQCSVLHSFPPCFTAGAFCFRLGRNGNHLFQNLCPFHWNTGQCLDWRGCSGP